MKDSKKGSLALFTVAAFYGLYGIFSRLIGNSFGNFSQNWARNIIVVVLILIIIFVSKTKFLKIKRKDVKWIIFWLLSGSWVTVLTFIAFNNLQIGTTYFITYTSMISAGFLSGKIFFKEKLDLAKKLSLILCFAGLIVIYRFSIDPSKIYYVFLALLSGFMTGVWNTISKKFSDNYPSNQLVLMDALSGVLAALLGTLIFREALPLGVEPIKWFWVFVFAIIQIIDVGLVVYGFKNIEAQIGSMILPVEIIFATIFSYLIFSEVPTVMTLVGGLLILSGAIVPNLNIKNNDN